MNLVQRARTPTVVEMQAIPVARRDGMPLKPCAAPGSNGILPALDKPETCDPRRPSPGR